MNDELELDLQRALRTAPAPLDIDAADRIWRDVEAVLRGDVSDDGAGADLLAVDGLELRADGHRGRGPMYGWLAVAAAVVLVLVAITVWRGRSDGAIGEVPDTTQPSTTPASTVPYGEIPPLDDASIFYLPDPMPDGWHVAQVTRSVDLELDPDVGESGPRLATEPPIASGRFRGFDVLLVNETADAFVQLGVVETSRSREADVPDGAEGVRVGGRFVSSLDSAGDGVAAGPDWAVGRARWTWAQDGRVMLAEIGGDTIAAAQVIDAVQHVPAASVLAAVQEGQAFGRSLPVLDQVTLGNGAVLSLRGPSGDGVAVCADTVVATCSFVGADFGAGDRAFGRAGTQKGAFQYGWIARPSVRDLGVATVIDRAGGSFVTDVAPDGSLLDPSPDLAAFPTAGWELIGMPRLAELDASTGTIVPVVPPPSGSVPVTYGGVPSLDDASIFYLPDPMPEGWHVSQVLHGVDFELDREMEGDALATEPPISEGTFREFYVSMYRDDGTAFAQLKVVETPFHVADRDATRMGTTLNPDAYSALGLAPTGDWTWVRDGREMWLSVVGDAAVAAPLVDAVHSVDAASVLAAVADGQAAGAALPVIETQAVADDVTLTARGPDDRVLAVCADAAIATCAFVGAGNGVDAAFGWAGTAVGAFSYGWVPRSLDEAVDGTGLTVYPNDHGMFLTGIEDAVRWPEGVISGPGSDLVGMPRLASLDPWTGVEVPVTPGVSDVPVVVGAELGEIEAVDDMSVFYLPAPMPQGWHVARVRPVIDEADEIDATVGEFVVPPSPELPAGVLRSFQVDLVADDGSAAQLAVTELPAPVTDLPGDTVSIGNHDVHVIESVLAGSPGGASLFRDEVDGRSWTWVQDEREISLSGDLSDADATALIESIFPVRGADVIAAVRAGQAFAVRLPVVAEQQIGRLRLTARGSDGRVLFLCAEGDGPSRCASGLTQWNLPGVAQLEVPDGAGGVMLIALVPDALDAEILPTATEEGAEIAPSIYLSSAGTFVTLPAGDLELQIPGSRLGLVRPDRELIGMPRVVAAA